MSRAYRLVKEASWILAGQISSVIGSLLLVRVLTGYLEPSEYGHLALGLTFASLINQVVMVGLIAGIGRFYSIAIEENAFSSYIRASTQLLIVATLIVIGIAALLIPTLFFFGYMEWVGLVLAALMLSIFNGCSSALNAVQVAARQRSKAALLSGVDSGLKIVFSVGAIILLGPSGTSAIIGYAVSSLLVMALQFYFLTFLFDKNASNAKAFTGWERRIWMYAMPFSAWGIFTWAQQASDRWALQNFANADEVGLYAVIFQLGWVPMGVAASFITSSLLPILYTRSGSLLDHAKNLSVHHMALFFTKFAIAVTLLLYMITLFIHQWVFTLLASEKYQSVSYLLPWMILAGGCFSAGQILALKLMSEMKTKNMISVKITTASLSAIMSFLGAFRFGIQGVVGAILVFSLIYLVWMLWLAAMPTNRCKGVNI